MKLYEHVFIARQDLSHSQAEALGQKYSEIISNHGGEIVNSEYWGLRSLAYPIKKYRKGHYVLLNISASSDAVHEMERLMRFDEDIIRHLTIKVDKHPEGPSVILQNKGGDRRKPRRDDDGDDRGRAAYEDRQNGDSE
ncbi:MAG: 30S ribosomal protein S6 [Alphaproteobacteria bacterium]|jgi:small subunit ribosomal protein S6|nr:30S ribosomal protein S6 [Alphaproteobacteria bacterium]